MRKFTAFILAAVLLCLPQFSVCASAAYDSLMKEKLYSDIYLLRSLDNQNDVLTKNTDKKSPCPAFNKIMTVAMALKMTENIDSKITITQKMINALETKWSLTMKLQEGEKISMRSLLYAIMIYGANDACEAVAIAVSGNREKFMKEINDYISSLGCSNTNLVNPTGFDADGQYTTAADIATVMAEVVKIPVFTDIFSARTYRIPKTNKSEERSYTTTNKIFYSSSPAYYYAHVTGSKSGATDEAGYCAISTATKDGYTYVAVAMKGKIMSIPRAGSEVNSALYDNRKMFSWAYSNIRFNIVAKTDQVVSSVDVIAGRENDHVSLVPAREVSSLVPALVDSAGVLIEPVEESVPKKVYAPVKKGDVICQAKILYAGEVIDTVDLVAAESVGLSVPRLVLEKVKNVLTSKIFIAILIILAALILIYIIFTIADNLKEKRNRIHIVGKK